MSGRYYCTPHDKFHEESDFGGQACKDYILYESRNDQTTFGRFFLPKDYVRKNTTPRYHRVIGADLISTEPGGRLLDIVFRGGAKTTLKKTAALHKLGFNAIDNCDPDFFCWVGEEQSQAIDHIKYMRNHIDYNETFRYYFGDLSGERVGNRWTEKDFITSRGDRVLAKGTTQRLRGKTQDDVRYTLIILDDFESELNTKTQERRSEIQEWFGATVLGALDESPGRAGAIWLSNTIVHYDSVSQQLLDGFISAVSGWSEIDQKEVLLLISEEIITGKGDLLQRYNAWAKKNPSGAYTWKVNFVPATNNKRLDPDSIAAWQSRFSVPWLEKKKHEFSDSGVPHKFAQEFMNDARDESSAPVKISQIRDHYGQLKIRDGQAYLVVGGFDDKGAAYAGDKLAIPVYIYMGVDPAQVVGPRTDYSSIVILAIDSEQRRYTLEIFRKRIPGFEIAPKMVEFAQDNPISRVNIDPTGGSEFIANAYNRLAKDKRRLLPGISRKDVKYPHGIKKEQRNIDAIAPIVHSGQLYMRPEHKSLLADELWELPSPKYDDVTDAFYLANYTARKRYPRSATFDAKELESGEIAYKSLYPQKKKSDWRSKNIWKGTWKGG